MSHFKWLLSILVIQGLIIFLCWLMNWSECDLHFCTALVASKCSLCDLGKVILISNSWATVNEDSSPTVFKILPK